MISKLKVWLDFCGEIVNNPSRCGCWHPYLLEVVLKAIKKLLLYLTFLSFLVCFAGNKWIEDFCKGTQKLQHAVGANKNPYFYFFDLKLFKTGRPRTKLILTWNISDKVITLGSRSVLVSLKTGSRTTQVSILYV